MQKVKFSVVINTFERETQIKDLKKCFKSVFSQTYKPSEIILIHSGHKKIDPLFLKKYKNKIHIINCKKSTNISQARNIGAKRCTKQFLAFIDDDDLWGINYLKKSLSFIKKNDAKIILSSVYVTVNNKIVLFREPKSDQLLNYFDINIGAMGSNIIIHKKEFNSVKGFDPKLIVSEDKGIIMDLIIKKKKIFFQKNYVWYNLGTPNSVTKQPIKMINGLTAFINKYGNFMNLKNKIFIYKKIFSYKKKINYFYFLHFMFFLILNKL